MPDIPESAVQAGIDKVMASRGLTADHQRAWAEPIVRAALEHLDLDEIPEFTATAVAGAMGVAREWGQRNRDQAETEPAEGICRGFRWIGQSFATCDGCGKPPWEHEGMQRLRGGAKLTRFDDDDIWEVVPWKPGEAEAIKQKWT